MITVDGLTVHAGAFALDDVSFTIPSGSYLVLLGRSGSGKTTLMEAICGLRPIEAGRILLMGRDVTRLKAAERGVGYVPQDGALFTAMTVRQQLAFPLRIRRWPHSAAAARVAELAELVGVTPLLDRRPQRLSGGEVQRVALGRALAADPDILCLDEPLSALDEPAREELYSVLQAIREATRVTTLHITHNLTEAQRLADVCLLLRDRQLHPVPLADLQERTVQFI